MSILIKGVEMPKCCDVCIFSEWSNLHQTACCKLLEYRACFKDYSREYKTARSEHCPLVEIPPHGRLIDERVAYDKIAEQECSYYMDKCFRNAARLIQNAIDGEPQDFELIPDEPERNCEGCRFTFYAKSEEGEE